jgi:hypothetical protein
MAWVRVDDRIVGNPKVVEAARQLGGRFAHARVLSVFIEALAHCNAQQTDGFIAEPVARRFLSDPRPIDVLAVLSFARLVDAVDGGFRVSKYAEYQFSRAEISRRREAQDVRRRIYANPDLVARVRDRDGDHCRVCRTEVRWTDRRSARGGVLALVDPAAAVAVENVVVACSGCRDAHTGVLPVQAPVALPGRRSQLAMTAGSIRSAVQHERLLAAVVASVAQRVQLGQLPANDLLEEAKKAAALAGLPYDGESIARAYDRFLRGVKRAARWRVG